MGAILRCCRNSNEEEENHNQPTDRVYFEFFKYLVYNESIFINLFS